MTADYPGSKALIGLSVIVLAAILGCINVTNWNQVRHERVLERQASTGASALDVQTAWGSIEITGADTQSVNVTATVCGAAPTQEQAMELAEQVEIRTERVGATLQVRAEKPEIPRHCSISVSYVIVSPRTIDVRCESGYGALSVSGIEGTVGGKTGNGSIHLEDIQGSANLHSAYGAITCRNAAGETIRLHSGNGSVAASDIRGSADLESSYGAVTCERFSDGDLRLRSGNGRVVVVNASFGMCEARSSYGHVGGNDLRGESITFQSGNGDIELTRADTGTARLSSNHGTVKAQGISARELAVHSGNGNVKIVCSPAAPADLKAEATSSYGRIDFAAPPGFSGEVHLRTDYGTIHTTLPITATGDLSKKKIAGTIGEGNGSIQLKSGNGSIDLR